MSNTCTLDTWLDMCGLNTINLHCWQKTCEIFSHLWATCLQTNYLLTEKGNNEMIIKILRQHEYIFETNSKDIVH